MPSLAPEFLIMGLLPLAIVAPVLWWFRRRRADEIFTKVTPGEVPAPGMPRDTARIGGSGEYAGTVAVRFTPPDGLTPGLAGTVLDGRANVVDVSATLIDLAVRGYFTIVAHYDRPPGAKPGTPAEPGGTCGPRGGGAPPKPSDWELVATGKPPAPDLLAFERKLLAALFAGRDRVTMTQLKSEFGMSMREAQVDLYREVVDRGWYTKHPLDRNRRLGCLGGVLLVVAVLFAAALAYAIVRDTSLRSRYGWFPMAVPLGILVASGLLLWGGRGRTPRTATGTAARIQTLGFRQYLTVAEADQIAFDEAADIFSRYLPYALIFGVAKRWASVFGEVAAKAHLAGVTDLRFDLSWIDGMYLLDTLSDIGWNAIMLDQLFDGDGIDLFGGLDALGDLDLGDMAQALSGGLEGLAEGMSGFLESAGSLFDLGDGCGDGCDIDF